MLLSISYQLMPFILVITALIAIPAQQLRHCIPLSWHMFNGLSYYIVILILLHYHNYIIRNIIPIIYYNAWYIIVC